MCPLEWTIVSGMTKLFCFSPSHLWTGNFLQPGWWTLAKSTSFPQSFHLAEHVQMCQHLCLPFWTAWHGYWLPLWEQQSSHPAMHECVSTTLQTSYTWNCCMFWGLWKSLKAWGLVFHQVGLMMLALLGPLPNFGLLHSAHQWLG